MAAPKKNRPYIKIIYVRADGYRSETTIKGPTVTDKMIKAAHAAELVIISDNSNVKKHKAATR